MGSIQPVTLVKHPFKNSSQEASLVAVVLCSHNLSMQASEVVVLRDQHLIELPVNAPQDV